MIFAANLLVAVALIALGFGFKEIHDHWGYPVYMAFCAGWICASIIWQLAHRSRYGVWFEPPVISSDASSETAGTDFLATMAEISGDKEKAGGGREPPRAIKS